jgi:hypothetical protein
MMTTPPSNYTNGEPFIVTLRRVVGERTTAVSYLLPDGTRRTVNIDQAVHTPDVEQQIGQALALGRTSRVKGRTQP